MTINDPRFLRATAGTVIILGCLGLLKSAASHGLSEILRSYAASDNSLAAANESVRLTPSNAGAHRARARLMSRIGHQSDALKQMELAVSLRPRDDYLWLELGNLLEGNGEPVSALQAFNNAVDLAPHYGHPRWQRGNLLLRMGRYEEAFSDLRDAAVRNRYFMPALIDLAWGFSLGDAETAASLIQIEDDQTRLAFVRYLARKGRGEETLKQFYELSDPISESMFSEIVTSLIQTKSYREAFALWSKQTLDSNVAEGLHDGGFEEDFNLDNTIFGWQALNNEKVHFALDVKEPFEGSRSLRISFSGYDNQAPPVSQLVVVKGEETYRVSFAFMARDLVTGAYPLIRVVDVKTNEIIGQSASLKPVAQDRWSDVVFDCKVPQGSEAVLLRLEREDCNPSPCPIFGHIWLDSFVFTPLKEKD